MKNFLKKYQKNSNKLPKLSDLITKTTENNNEYIKILNEMIEEKRNEINSLEYAIALKIDKRTYFQYYWSLLKKKNLILFTFYEKPS